jgi:PA14 domain
VDLITGSGTGLQANYYNGIADSYGLQLEPHSNSSSYGLQPNSCFLASAQLDPTIDFNWHGGPVNSLVQSDNFSAEWTGQVLAPETGRFTFTTNSDDGIRVWVDSQNLIDAWNDHAPQLNSGSIDLTAGQKYDIKVDYYQRSGGSIAQLYWAAPSIMPQIVPQDYLYAPEAKSPTQPPAQLLPGNGNGLQGQYFNGTSLNLDNLALTRNDSNLNFNWQGGQVDALVQSDNFSAEWTGQVLAPETGRFTFTTNSDDGIRVWVDGQNLIDAWNDHAPQLNSGSIDLTAGQKYDIKVDYYQRSGGSIAQLYWAAPDIMRQIVPQAYLYTPDASVGIIPAAPTPEVPGPEAAPETPVNIDPAPIPAPAPVPPSPSTDSASPGPAPEPPASAGTAPVPATPIYLDNVTSAPIPEVTPTVPTGSTEPIPSPTPIPDPDPVSDTSGSIPSASQISLGFDDSILPNEGHPSGVPSYYRWANGPSIDSGNNIPEGWNAFTAWGQIYVESGWNPPTECNTRVQIRALDAWYLSKSTNEWILLQHADSVNGAAYVEDFANDENKPADAKDESMNGGGTSVTAGNGYNYHFWTSRVTIDNPDDIAGIYTRFQSRLVLDDPNGVDDRASARYLASDGADYWRSLYAGWASDWSNNGAVGSGRFKFVTSDWQNFSMETLTPEQLSKNPPPAA